MPQLQLENHMWNRHSGTAIMNKKMWSYSIQDSIITKWYKSKAIWLSAKKELLGTHSWEVVGGRKDGTPGLAQSRHSRDAVRRLTLGSAFFWVGFVLRQAFILPWPPAACWQSHGSAGTTGTLFWEKLRISPHWINSGCVSIIEWINWLGGWMMPTGKVWALCPP